MKNLIELTNKIAPSHARRRRRAVDRSNPAEALEARTMLSNVTVNFQNGDLTIVGDNNDNVVEVTQNANSIAIEGHNGTTINGVVGSYVLLIADVPDDVIVNLQGGDNGLLLNDMIVGDDVQIRSGGGDDILIMDGCDIDDDVRVRSGHGNDVVFLDSNEVGDLIDIKTGSGADKVGVGGNHVTVNNLKINTSKGRDGVVVGEIDVLDTTEIKTGRGADQIFIAELETDNLDVRMSAGNDDFSIEDSEIFNDTDVNGGSGTDSFEPDTVTFGNPANEISIESNVFVDRDVEALELVLCMIQEIEDDFPDYSFS